MPPAGYAFGPFRLDLRAHRLTTREGPVPLSAHLVDLLAHLVGRAGELVTKEQLLDALWPGVFVTENTLTRAISDLRRALGDDPRGAQFIQTVARRGYRFVAAVVPDPGQAGEHALDDLRTFVASIPLLETLDRAALHDATHRLEQAAPHLAGYAPLHVALASARALTVEFSRTTAPDRAAAAEAEAHAREACRLAPDLAEAWATLAFVLTVSGRDLGEARAAARRAVQIEPDGWRHHFRLALATWGEERLRAVQRTLTLVPGFPFACLLGAMVHVARGAFAPALDLLDEGAARQADADRSAALPGAGLHWLRGAVLAARGDVDASLAALAHEVAGHDPGRLYSTEFAVDALHWRAGVLTHRGDVDHAMDALDAALALNPRHGRSLVARAALLDRTGRGREAEPAWQEAARALTDLHAAGRSPEAAACAAMRAVLRGEPDVAFDVLGGLLSQAPAGHTGWWMPIDPWLATLRGTAGLARLQRRLGQRAV